MAQTEVINLFMKNPEKWYSIDMVCEETGISKGTISRMFGRLRKDGIIDIRAVNTYLLGIENCNSNRVFFYRLSKHYVDLITEVRNEFQIKNESVNSDRNNNKR